MSGAGSPEPGRTPGSGRLVAPDGRIPVGYGLPWWVDTEHYLSADETRSLGSWALGEAGDPCPLCGVRRATDRAHIVRKGMGGSKEDGPQVFI